MANVNTSSFTYNEAPIRASTNQQNFVSEIRPATTQTVSDPNQRPFSTLPHINSKPNVHFTTNNVPNYSSGAKIIGQETRPSIAMSSIMRSVPSPPVIGLPPQPVQIANPSVHLNYSTTSPFPYATTKTNKANPQLNLPPQQLPNHPVYPAYPAYPTYNQVTSTINHNTPVTTIGAGQKIEADDRVQVKASQNQHHQWQSYYQKKPVNSKQPVPVAEEKTGNCCMIIFGILGLLALGGIIAGIILASRSHGGFGQQGGVNQGQGIFSNATSTTVLIPTNSTTTTATANNTNSTSTGITTNSTTNSSVSTTNLNNGVSKNSTTSITGTTSVSQVNTQNMTVVNTNSSITKPNSTTVPSNSISSQTVNYTIASNATSQSITYSTINATPNQNTTIAPSTNPAATTTTNNTTVNTATVSNNTSLNSTSTPTSTSTSASTSTSTSTSTWTWTSLGPAVSIKPIAQDPTQPTTTTKATATNVESTSTNTTNVATLPSTSDNKPSPLIQSTSVSPISQDLQTPNSTQSLASQSVISQTTSTVTQNQTSVSVTSVSSSNSSLLQPGIKFVDPILTNSTQSSTTNNYGSAYGNGGSFSNSYTVKVAPTNVTNSSAQSHRKLENTHILKMRHHLSRHE